MSPQPNPFQYYVSEVAALAISVAAYWIKGIDILTNGGIGQFNLNDRLELECLRRGKAEVAT